MNRLLLALNVAAAAAIAASNSSALLAAISPYGHRAPTVPAVVVPSSRPPVFRAARPELEPAMLHTTPALLHTTYDCPLAPALAAEQS